METNTNCPTCGKRLAAGTPAGPCAECLLKAGLDAEAQAGRGPGRAGFTPPSLEALAPQFPQLVLLRLIGRGGMGAVYQARQPALERFVALKLLPAEAAQDPGFAERFSREARALARLNHPNIVTIYDFGHTGTLPYLLMEYVDGKNLRECQRAQGLAPAQALGLVPQICDALQFAHSQGVVHRDIKPENILLDSRGWVKITDFGIARMIGELAERDGITGVREVIGTPHYMAPEQVEKPQTVDHRADIYSLGVVLYELLTGELPLGRFAPPSQRVAVDARLDEVVLRALEKQPERRFQEASQVKTAVETIVQTPGAGVAATPGTNSAPAGRTGTGPVSSSLLVVLGVSAAVLLAAGGWVGWKVVGRLRNTLASHTGLVPAGRLQYGWKAGQNFAYTVQVEATAEDYIETVSGSVSYQVRNVDGDTATLVCYSHLTPAQRRPIPGKAFSLGTPFGAAHFWPAGTFGQSREIQVNASGRVVSQTGQNTALPRALGALELLAFEPLAPDGAATWSSQGDCAVSQSTAEPWPPMPHFGQPRETTLPAREEVHYRLGAVAANEVRIHKDYTLQTREPAGDEPRLRLTGEGTVVFDTALQLARSTEFKGTLIENRGSRRRQTPLTLTCKLVTEAERQATPATPGSAKAAPRLLTAAELEEALAELNASDWGRRLSAATKLASAEPCEPREGTAQRLSAALNDSNWSVREAAARGLGIWGTTNAAQGLLQALDDSEFSVRWAAMGALAQLKIEAAATPIAKRLAVRTDTLQAARALRELGAPAEAAVVQWLREPNPEAQRAACRILKDIGSSNSVPALEAASTNADSIVAMLAREALPAARARSRTNPSPSLQGH